MSPGTTKWMVLALAPELGFIRGPCNVRLVQCHAQAREAARMRPEFAGRDLGRDAFVNDEREELRRRVAAAKSGLVVEIAEVQCGEHLAQAVGRAADIDDDAVGVELIAAELCV